jgi:hypothetical protein
VAVHHKDAVADGLLYHHPHHEYLYRYDE